MAQLLVQAQVARRAVEVTGDDVPADASFCQMVERRDAPCKSVGMFIRERRRDAETQVAGRVRHQRNECQRIVQRDLHAVAQGGVDAAGVHVVHAQHVRQEDGIEAAPFQQLRQFDPVLRIGIAVAGVRRMGPQAGRLVPGGVHLEGVETHRLHGRLACLVCAVPSSTSW